MAQSRIIRDPDHPDFPHAQSVGYARGCRCTPCSQAKQKQRKANKLRRLRAGGTTRIASPAVTARVAAHLRMLTAIDGVCYTTVAAAINGSAGDVRKAADGRVSPRMAVRILAVTPDAIADHIALVDPTPYTHIIGTHEALGYPLWWLGDRAGINLRQRGFPTGKFMFRATAEAIQALADQIDGRAPDSDRDGIPKKSITHAATHARKKGYLPPDCYNEDRTLNGVGRAWEAHRIAAKTNHARTRAEQALLNEYRAEQYRRRLLAVLYASIIEGIPPKEAGTHHGTHHGVNLARDLGIRFLPKGQILDPASFPVVNVIRPIIAGMPVGIAERQRGWTIDDIDPDWDSAAVLDAVRAAAAAINPPSDQENPAA